MLILKKTVEYNVKKKIWIYSMQIYMKKMMGLLFVEIHA